MNKLPNILKYTSIALAALYIITFIVLALLRINYKFELEWLEGGQLEHVVRILDGKQIYVPPSIDFIPYIYTPLYNYLGAFVALFTGIGFLPLRLISFISTIGIFAFLYLIVKRETQSRYWGFISVGLYAASYRICGFWFDIARVDSLFLFLFIVSVYFLLKGIGKQETGSKNDVFSDKQSNKNIQEIKTKSRLLLSFNFQVSTFNYIISGFLAGLSFLTKQSVIFMLAPILLYFILKKEKKGIYYFVSLLVITLSVSIYFNIATQGWYWFWNFGLPTGHHWQYKYLYSFWINDLIEPLGISIVIIFILFISETGNWKLDSGNTKKSDSQFFNSQFPINSLFYILLLVGCLANSLLLRLHYSSYLNVIMPAIAIIALIAPIGFKKLIDVINLQNKILIQILVYLLVIFQFIILNFNPMKALPTKADKIAGDRFIKQVKSIKGEVFIPCHSYISRYAGKKSYAHAVVMHDLLISKSSLGFKLQEELETAYKNKKFTAVILNSDMDFEFLNKYYYKAGSLFSSDSLNFFTVIGKTRPDDLYLPR